MGKHTDSVDHNVLRRIVGKGKGWVFTPSDFQDLDSRTAIRLAIMRHKCQGTIRQLARELYQDMALFTRTATHREIHFNWSWMDCAARPTRRWGEV